MRISDWSSDVCSSDLAFHFRTSQAHHPQARGAQKQDFAPVPVAIGRQQVRGQANRPRFFRPAATAPIERAPVHRNTQAQAAPGPNESPCGRSEENTSELQSLLRISYAVFCLTKKRQTM